MEVYSPAEDSWLLEKAILKENLKGKNCLDVGTGSGIQVRAMVKAGAKEVVAIDINPDAIKQAKENTHKLGHNITFIKKSFINFFKDSNEKFDFIAFNPPYVPSEKIKWKDTDGGKKGREIIDVFLREFDKYLSPKGTLLLLVSSHNNEKEIIKELKGRGLFVEIVAQQKLFFEELFILRIGKELYISK